MRNLHLSHAAVLALVALTSCNQYNRLIDLDTTCDQKWSDLQAQLQRRADLVPNLVATVKGSAQHEEKTLTEVAQARAAASSIQLSGEDLQDPAKMQAFEQAQARLGGAISRLLVTQEQYPQLQANQQFHALQVQLEGTENRILRSREEYNAAARAYNAELGKIRGAAVRRATGTTFKPRAYFQATGDVNTAPKVNF